MDFDFLSKTSFLKFFLPLVMSRLVKIQFRTQKFAKIFIKMHRFRFIDQKQNSKGFFRPQVMAYKFKCRFCTKKFLAKIFIKMHGSCFFDQNLNLKGFFRPLVVASLFKSRFSTKKFTRKSL